MTTPTPITYERVLFLAGVVQREFDNTRTGQDRAEEVERILRAHAAAMRECERIDTERPAYDSADAFRILSILNGSATT